MRQSTGSFDNALTEMYVIATDAGYYTMFFDSVFHYLDTLEIQKKGILDIGCGNGKLCRRFIDAGAASTVGIDISPDQIRKAQREFSTPEYRFMVQDAYVPFDLHKQFDIVTCIYTLHFAKSFKILMQACLNIFNHLNSNGIAIVLDITHDYVYDKARMKKLKQLTMYEYQPEIPEGSIPVPWQIVKGLVHTAGKTLRIDHVAMHGSNLVRALKEVGFETVERKQLIHANQEYVELWGPDGFNHHLLFCRKRELIFSSMKEN